MDETHSLEEMYYLSVFTDANSSHIAIYRHPLVLLGELSLYNTTNTCFKHTFFVTEYEKG